MKRVALVVSISLSAVLILLPLICPVNHAVANPVLPGGSLNADGMPAPPPIPPTRSLGIAGTLVADGMPAPPPIPPRSVRSLGGLSRSV
jgi:hypothetical protein